MNCYQRQYDRSLGSPWLNHDYCMSRVKSEGNALSNVIHKTQEICLEAVKQDPEAIFWVEKQYHNEELAMAAVKTRGLNLEYFNQDVQTVDVCIAAIQDFLPARVLVKENIRNNKRYRKALLEAQMKSV